MVCVSPVQDGPTGRSFLEVFALRPGIRYVPDTSGLSTMRDAVFGHEVFGLRRTPCHRRMGCSLPCALKGLTGGGTPQALKQDYLPGCPSERSRSRGGRCRVY